MKMFRKSLLLINSPAQFFSVSHFGDIMPKDWNLHLRRLKPDWSLCGSAVPRTHQTGQWPGRDPPWIPSLADTVYPVRNDS